MRFGEREKGRAESEFEKVGDDEANLDDLLSATGIPAIYIWTLHLL
jgi:hypothetical protein